MKEAAVDAVIVGAGFGGLGMGAQLVRNNITSFVILERSPEVGGTWHDNVYPGVACDIPSHLYSYSFRSNNEWSRRFAPGSEIKDYLVSTVNDEGLAPFLRLNSEVLDMRWDDTTERWLVSTPSGIFRSRVLIMCAGRLSKPSIPDIPGLDSFPGPVFHTARWDGSVDFSKQRTAVVGSGASAVQIVPHLANAGGDVVVFQRSAPYVMPRGDRAYSPAERKIFSRVPGAAARHREELFWHAESQFAARTGDPFLIEQLASQALGHLTRQVPNPELRDQLTPNYTLGCKRVLLSDDFYPALGRDNVTLEPSGLARVHGNDLQGISGHEHKADVLVMATGFHSTRLPFAAHIFGMHGRRLLDRWNDNGMQTYLSTMVHGFPNLFLINGPNASLGHNSAIIMIEAQIGYVLQALAHLLGSKDRVVMVSEEAQSEYVRAMDAAASSTVWITGGCRSWYVEDTTRRLELIWPGLSWEFQDMLATFDALVFQQ